jgi:hypothetical protein
MQQRPSARPVRRVDTDEPLSDKRQLVVGLPGCAGAPAVDVNRLFATVGAIAIAYLFTRARISKARARGAIHMPDRP